ncbi:6425_t:CDS:2 [Ambispora gerdemannii]|uniref:6425_t:CDS:1 n=1 Tax=Ambispora gerdemannii TaxID=144530 RepID=A0A9N8ZDB2_9GLOM|nr:6425_t:CDS:2 [Ambispora gerdemannii]
MDGQGLLHLWKIGERLLPLVPRNDEKKYITMKNYYFNRISLDRLKNVFSSSYMYNNYDENMKANWISTNDALVAHIWRLIMRARGDKNPLNSMFFANAQFHTQENFDIREKIRRTINVFTMLETTLYRSPITEI